MIYYTCKTMTMEEIARLSGTSRSTVHAVLSDKPWVSEPTRRKVLEVVSRYHYQPNRLARALGRRSTHLVALILKDIMNPFNSRIVEGINSVLAPKKYSTLLLSTEDDHEREVQAVGAALSYQVDGIIITPQQIGIDLGHIWSLIARGTPLVTLGSLPGMETSRAEFSERGAGRLAAEYLLEMGHTRIVHLRGPISSGAAEQRAAGFKDAVIQAGLHFTEEMIVPAGATMKDGRQAAAGLFPGSAGAAPQATAFLCYNDLVAAGVYKAAAELGISIPEDLSVVGVDDIELAAVFGPPLTTVMQPCFEMGKTMAEFLLAQMEGPETAKSAGGGPAGRPLFAKTFSPSLAERQSVRREPRTGR
jgi:LacI family transcriptional regulator